MTEDEMVGWLHQLNGEEFEQALRDGEGQGNLACCNPWGHKESDTAYQLNSNKDGVQSRQGIYVRGALQCVSFNDKERNSSSGEKEIEGTQS